MMKVSSKVREKSSCSSVGASDGGSETTPQNVASPNGRPISETTRMPISVPPMTLRAFSATISTKPSRQSSAGSAALPVSGPSVTSVTG